MEGARIASADRPLCVGNPRCIIVNGPSSHARGEKPKNAKGEPEPKFRLRYELIRRVNFDKITPDDAELKAKRVHCSPLELRPELLGLDQRIEAQWTLLVALVWIIERDPMAVCAVWRSIFCL